MGNRAQVQNSNDSRAARAAISLILCTTLGLLLAVACRMQVARPASGDGVLATLGFLADIAQHVAGDRLTVGSLIPPDVDPHGFEPAPSDIARVARCRALITNGANLEGFLSHMLDNVGGERLVIEASKGLVGRKMQAGEVVDKDHEVDPHFWLDPNNVITYVGNIREGLSQVDPDGKASFASNAEAYTRELQALDEWIREQVQQIPPERRLLVTNHESFGYWADRYGFRIIGTILPSVTTGASPSAQQLAQLIEEIRASGAPAIFLETGSNPRLAEQVAQETGARIITNLATHSVGTGGGATASYIEMMRHNTRTIVDALQ